MEAQDKLIEGEVKWFNRAKGFGFITPWDGGAPLFCHFSAIDMGLPKFQELREGTKVLYRTKQNHNGTTEIVYVREVAE